MGKAKTQYSCQSCGQLVAQWSGRCQGCGAWNSFVEIIATAKKTTAANNQWVKQDTLHPVKLTEVKAENVVRYSSAINEFDRVLGGGVVPGAVVLLGGDPGIGKSTLLLQMAVQLAVQKKVLYVSGEESLTQISMRAQRMQLSHPEVLLLSHTQIEHILHEVKTSKPEIVIIDSIQTIYAEALTSAPGTISQVREVATELVRIAKAANITVFLVGHVTKEGTLAGPKVLEHMVDTVLYFEGQQDGRFRAIRTVKNRFGAVGELGVFAMTEVGLKEVKNPSQIFVTSAKPVAGSVVTVAWEGSRPILVELQSLVDEANLPNPRRVAIGIEPNRLTLVLAVLSRHGGMSTYNMDVFVNIVGGIKLTETAHDLALLYAILSSVKNFVIPNKTIVFGEVGLTGEVRPVQRGQDRLKEAQKLGYTHAIIPKLNMPKTPIKGIEIECVEQVQDLL